MQPVTRMNLVTIPEQPVAHWVGWERIADADLIALQNWFAEFKAKLAMQ